MEFLDGETLAHKIEAGGLEEAEALPAARQLCSGLAEAARSGILHRDLKPGNVILCKQNNASTRAVITDFGLAVETTDVSELEGGTPSYMAPELWRGGRASQASDVFSLGVILYEMVTGRKPFPALNKENVTFPPPVAPSKLVKNLPRRWDAAILPCLRENPDQRCSAADVLGVLDRKQLHRRPAVWVGIAACLALIAFKIPEIKDWFKQPPNRLVILPAKTSGDLSQRSQAILTDVANRVRQIQSGKATVSVIPPEKALTKGVITPEQAAKTFGATHALQVTLRPDSDGVSVEGEIIELRTGTRVKDYLAHFSEADLADLSAGLAGEVSWGLHLQREDKPEYVAAAAEASYKRGRQYMDQMNNDYVHAIPEFLEAAKRDPHSPLPLAGLAEAKARENRALGEEGVGNEAQAWLAKAEALDADSPRVRLTSGLLHLIADRNSEYLEALADYQRVKEIEPNNVEAPLRAGYAYDKLGKPNEARSEYQRARFLEPKNYKPVEYLGNLDFKQGDYEAAVTMYDQAKQLEPTNVDLYGSLAGAYIALGKDKEADDVLKHTPGGASTKITLNNAGAELAFQGKDAEAIRSYLRAIRQSPEEPILWLNLGDAQRRLHYQGEARKSYQTGSNLADKQLRAHPGNAAIRAYFAYFQARLGKSRAQSEIVQALGNAKNDEVMLCAVHTYEALGDRAEAIRWAGKVSRQTLKNVILRHADLAGLRQDSRFKILIAQTQ